MISVCYNFTFSWKKDYHMKTTLFSRGCCIGVLLVLASLSPDASEPDWPDADALLREAARIYWEITPGNETPIFQQRIALRFAERGEFGPMFEYLEKYQGTDKNKGQSEHAYSDFVPIVGQNAFEHAEFGNLIKVLRFVPNNVLFDRYNRQAILAFLFRENRFDDAEKLLDKLTHDLDYYKSFSPAQYFADQQRLYAVFQKDEQGHPVPKLQTAFVQHRDYHLTTYSGRPLAEAIFFSHTIPDQVWEAVDHFKDNKEDEAKTLFDDAVEKLAEPPKGWFSGMIGNTNSICGVAAFQLELGRVDWAKETLRKAEDYYDQYEREFTVATNRQFYPVTALADIMIVLGETDAARALIEQDIPLHNDLSSPLIHCDLAVAMAKNGDQAGAIEILHNVMKVAETLDHPVTIRTFMNGLYEATQRIGDKEICRQFIEWAIQMAAKYEGDDRSWSIINDILGPAVQAQCWIEDFDGARQNLEKMLLWVHDPYFRTYVKTLVALKKYDLLESFLREVDVDARLEVFAWLEIAQSKFEDGDKVGASEAINAAMDCAKYNHSGYTYGSTVLLVDIAMDLKYSKYDSSGRPPFEIIDETFRWHRELLARPSTDAGDYTEEELRHLLRMIVHGHAPASIEEKLCAMGAALDPLMIKMVQENIDMNSSLFRRIDIMKAEPKELRKTALMIREKYDGEVKCYEALGEVGLPEDVPGLLVWKEYVHAQVIPAFQAVAKIATSAQLPEIEKAAEEAERIYFERRNEIDEKYHEEWSRRWTEELKPEIDKALRTIRERI